ncbi:MAG: DUF4058 family protein [Deltaproteobacteria bacterium]|nr:DUF4058 family protein [Deltaproteobacteria bacterium]
MPILDHLSEEINDIIEFQSFHNAWAVYIAGELNEVLPIGFRAKPHAQIGNWEVDVRTDTSLSEYEREKLRMQYQVPPSSATTRATFPTELEIFVVNVGRRTQKIVGVIEIVSKANKDRPKNREAFVAKCYSLLSQGISLIMIDILATPVFNLHNQLLEALGIGEGKIKEYQEEPLYCSAYRINVDANEEPLVELWAEALKVGNELPELPLFITSEIAVPVKLEKAYMEICDRLKIFEE